MGKTSFSQSLNSLLATDEPIPKDIVKNTAVAKPKPVPIPTPKVEEVKPKPLPKGKYKKDGTPKSKPGPKAFKKGKYVKIAAEIPEEVYLALHDILPLFNGNTTSYLKKLIIEDMNKNYSKYISELKQTDSLKLVITREEI